MAPKKRARSAATTPSASQEDSNVELSQATSNGSTTTPTKKNRTTATTTSSPSTTTATSTTIDTVKVIRSKVLTPDPSGIVSIAVHPLGTHLCVARDNGSLQLYFVDMHQNVVHLNPIRRTGGQQGRGITKIAYVATTSSSANDAEKKQHQASSFCLLVAYHSGQMALLCTRTLLPLFVLHRQGGSIYDVAVSGRTIVAAAADGTWKTLHVASPNRSNATPEIEYLRSTPKVSGSERALCVAVSSVLQLAVGGDDGGNVVGWRVSLHQEDNKKKANQQQGEDDDTVRDTLRRENYVQKWSARIPKGVPLTVAIADKGTSSNQSPTVAVGTSIGDVHLLDAAQGVFLQTFSQHRGPVSTVIFDGQSTFFASGWHEALRSYRFSDSDEMWYPAEAKRRTHYHECTQLAVSSKLQVLFSAAKDGTVMHAPVATVFTAPAHYVDTTPQCFAFAQEKELLLQTRAGTRLEAFRLGRGDWIPAASLQFRGSFQIHSVWCDAAANLVVTATDVHVQVTRLRWADNGMLVEGFDQIVRRDAVGVTDVSFSNDGKSIYILSSTAILHVMLDLNGSVVEQSLAPLRARDVVLHRMVATEDRLLLFGERASCAFLLANDGTIVSPKDGGAPAVHIGGSIQVATLSNDPMSFHVELRGKNHQLHRHNQPTHRQQQQQQGAGEEQQSLQKLARTLPHDALFTLQMDNEASAAASSSAPVLVGSFGKGLLSVGCGGDGSWNMMKRLQVAVAFPLKQTNSMLVLERNVEGTVEALPLCWKVRRFGN